MEDTYRGVPRCPSCGATEREPHEDDCDLTTESED